MGALFAMLAPFVPGLVNTAEALIKTPKSGDTRKAAVMQALRAMISGLSATAGPAGSAPTQPTDPELSAFIETIFQQMKTSAAVTGIAPSSMPIYLIQGTPILLPGVKF